MSNRHVRLAPGTRPGKLPRRRTSNGNGNSTRNAKGNSGHNGVPDQRGAMTAARQFREMRIGRLFDVRSGDVHALTEVDPGATPLISCGEMTNGFIGRYDIPPDQQYSRAITVAYNGSWPLTS